jgi:4-hydroxy-3-polyprenylbenzoate decarboxylase
MYRDLQAYLHALEAGGELTRVRAEVSPILEIATITDLVSKSPAAVASRDAAAFDPAHAALGGRALWFERVEGSDFPLVINAFGSYSRVERALGLLGRGGLEALAARLASLTRPEPPTSLRSLLAKAREFLPLLRVPPRKVKRGICQEVVKLASRGEVDLTRLPLLKCWPFDGDPRRVGYDVSPDAARTAGGGGRYVTFAGVHTIHHRDLHEGKPPSHNIGMYRAQLVDATHLAMHWHMHHDGAAHWRSFKAAGEPRMPIALCLGGESVLPYAATAPLPPGISELLMAGFLNGRGIELVDAVSVPLRVPANSEIVIEGYVRADAGGIGFDPRSGEPLGDGAVFEGPFGDHTGFYSLPDRYPLVEVTAITHRRDAVYPTTIVGLPPQEDYYLGKATERVFLPLLKTLVHDIVDYHLPLFGCFHNCAFVKIEKAYPLQARRVMHSIWGAGQMAWTKMIVVVDGDVDVHDERAVMAAVATRCRFGRDVEIVRGPLDILDHAAPFLGAGGKIGFDATRRIAGEELFGFDLAPPRLPEFPLGEVHDRPLVDSLRAEGAVDLVRPDWGRGRVAFLVVAAGRSQGGAGLLERLLSRADDDGRPIDFAIALSEGVDSRDFDAALFHTLANFDPLRDVVAREGDRERLGLDATRKPRGASRGGYPVRDWPPILEHDPEMVARVRSRWSEYGLA